MKHDITRDTFDGLNHFSRVLMQQGRVQLDADWNEQVSILLNYFETLTRDLVGPSAGPEGACGFELVVEQKRFDNVTSELSKEAKKELQSVFDKEGVVVTPGRYYVGGWQARNEELVSFFNQPSKLAINREALKKMPGAAKGGLVVYLDVWERHITALDDDRIREIALGGPDTATRAQVMWALRVRAMRDDEGKVRPPPNNSKFQEKFDLWSEAQAQNRGLMRAGIEQQPVSADPCANSPESVYRGLENQLYRVEIHTGGAGWERKSAGDTMPENVATFKWSRDNASVVSAWLDGDEDILKITASRDQARGFAPGQWIELSDDRSDLEDAPGTLVQIKEAEAGSLTIDLPAEKGPVARTEFPNTPKVRRWDQEEREGLPLTAGAIAIQYDTWIALEDGVEVQFPKPLAPNEFNFRPGDYWLIPARVASRDIQWPWATEDRKPVTDQEKRSALPPHGVDHHYGLIGLLASAAGDAFTFVDLRRSFAPLKTVSPPS